MLLIDGVKYHLKIPKEEKQLEEMVKEHYQEIFGKDSIYFDLKKKLTSKAGTVSIPDGYIISLAKPFEWYILEGELSSHPLHEHITNQLNKFMIGIRNPNTQRELVDALYYEIDSNKQLRFYMENLIASPEIKGILFDLISKPPKIAVVMEEKGDEVIEACDGLKVEPIVVEFKTYVREGAEAVHVHSFEPVNPIEWEEKEREKPLSITIDDKLEYFEDQNIRQLCNDCLKQLESMGIEIRLLEDEWLSLWYKNKRFMYLGCKKRFFVCEIQRKDNSWTGRLRVKTQTDWDKILNNEIMPMYHYLDSLSKTKSH